MESLGSALLFNITTSSDVGSQVSPEVIAKTISSNISWIGDIRPDFKLPDFPQLKTETQRYCVHADKCATEFLPKGERGERNTRNPIMYMERRGDSTPPEGITFRVTERGFIHIKKQHIFPKKRDIKENPTPDNLYHNATRDLLMVSWFIWNEIGPRVLITKDRGTVAIYMAITKGKSSVEISLDIDKRTVYYCFIH